MIDPLKFMIVCNSITAARFEISRQMGGQPTTHLRVGFDHAIACGGTTIKIDQSLVKTHHQIVDQFMQAVG